MGRRRRISVKKRGPKRQHNKTSKSSRKLMLDMGRSDSFRYRLRIILEGIEGSETIYANINSKSMNLGSKEGKNYIEEKVTQESLTKEKAEEIIELLNRFSKYR